VVLRPNGDGHAVLTVNTDMGDFILDNMEPAILPWSQTPYRFLKRQSADNPARRVSIYDGRDPAVASISSSSRSRDTRSSPHLPVPNDRVRSRPLPQGPAPLLSGQCQAGLHLHRYG